MVSSTKDHGDLRMKETSLCQLNILIFNEILNIEPPYKFTKK